MLYGQVSSRERNTRSIEWKLDVRIASATRTSATEHIVNDDEKLQTVLAALEEAGKIGTIANPSEYIRAEMPMKWGLYDDRGLRPTGEPVMVYFGGIDPAQKILIGLGGSSKHVIGSDGATGTGSRSATPALVNALLKGLEYERPELAEWYEREQESQVYVAMALAQHYLRPPCLRFEFVAKTLTIGNVHGCEHLIGLRDAKVILATPLYVRQLELPAEPENCVAWDNEGP